MLALRCRQFIINLLDASVIENVAFGRHADETIRDSVWACAGGGPGSMEFCQRTSLTRLHTPIWRKWTALLVATSAALALGSFRFIGVPSLLLDEAPARLDNRTESDVIEAPMYRQRWQPTVVIAHRSPR